MKNTRISFVKFPNALGGRGYDFGCRTHFETLSLGSRGIAVRLQAVGGSRRYMIVTGCSTDLGAYEIARKLAPVDGE